MNLGGILSLFCIAAVLALGAAYASSEYMRKTALVLLVLAGIHAVPLVWYAWHAAFVPDVRCAQEVEK